MDINRILKKDREVRVVQQETRYGRSPATIYQIGKIRRVDTNDMDFYADFSNINGWMGNIHDVGFILEEHELLEPFPRTGKIKCTKSLSTPEGFDLFKPGKSYPYGEFFVKGESELYYIGDRGIKNFSIYGYEFEIDNTAEESEDIAAMINAALENDLLRRKSQLERELQSIEIDLPNLYDTIKRKIQGKEQIRLDLLTLTKENIEAKRDVYLKEVNLIKEHPATASLSATNGILNILTNELIINEPNTNRNYILGKMSISLPINPAENISFENNTTKRNGYEQGMHHPHIFENGRACFGTAESQIAVYRAKEEFYAVYVTLLNFLRTVDVEDCAGWYVSKWDEVALQDDGTWKVIREGHRPESDEYDGYGYYDGDDDYCDEPEVAAVCYQCDNDIYDEDEVYHCAECGEDFCERHATYYDELGKVICNSCFEEYYMQCTVCGKLFSKDDAEETLDGECACSTCIENNYIHCDECGQAVHKDADYIEQDGMVFCSEGCRKDYFGEEEEVA